MFISVSFYNLLIILLAIFILEFITYLKNRNNYQIKVSIIFFIIYIWLVIETTDIGKLNDIIYAITELDITPIQGKINLIIFEHPGLDYLLNIILFIPLGFLIPVIWNKYNLIKTTIVGIILSLLIEITQLFNYRSTDINDLLTNLIGTIIGYIIYRIISIKIRPTNNSINRISPIIYISISIIIMFLLKYD